MGEDSCRNNMSSSVEKKTNGSNNFVGNGDLCCSHQQHHHTTSISSCSEADSESTNTCSGEATVEDDEDNDFQYGPGIVSKLRTKFLSITMKQGRGGGAGFHSTMRRSCSLENILETKSFPEHAAIPHQKRFVQNKKDCGSSISPWSNLKRAKSMDTLLFNVESQSNDISETDSEKDSSSSSTMPTITNGQDKVSWREPKLIRRKDGPLNRPVLTICDEELPKPDTVKTYKRMFEPADSKKNGSMSSNVRRRPPVLRASAKSVSSTNLKSVTNGNKMNGVANHTPAVTPPSKILPPKPKVCAKDIAKINNHNNLNNNIPALMPNNSTLKKCKNVQKNDVTDVEAQVRNMNMKNVNDSQKMVVVQAETVNDEPAQKPRESNFRRNLRAIKHIEGVTDHPPKPPIPLHKPQMMKKTTTTNKIPTPTSSPVVPASKIPEKMPITKREDNNNDQQQQVIESSPAQKHNGVCNHSNLSNGIVEKFNSDLCRNGISVIKNQLDDESKTSTVSKSNTKTVSNVIDDKSVDCTVGVSNGLEEVIVAPSRILSEFSEKAPEIPHPLPALTTNCLAVVTNGEESSSLCKKLVNGSGGGGGNGNNVPSSGNSMVFDFRGKEVTSHVALQPAPFGCKAAIISKKRALVMIDGKESVPYLNGCYATTNGNSACNSVVSANFVDDEDDYFVDYSVPAPCGLVFEGENVRVGKGALLSTRNKDLKIHFDEDVEKNTFVYPSESSMLVTTDDSSLSDLSSLENNSTTATDGASESNDVTPTSQAVVTSPNSLLTTATKLKSVPSINTNGTSSNSSSSLMSYTPSVLRTVDNIQPGLFRVDKDKALKKNDIINDSEQENRNNDDNEVEGMLKPADPDLISSWSLSANTSDLLF